VNQKRKIVRRMVRFPVIIDFFENGDATFQTLTPQGVPCIMFDLQYKDVMAVTRESMKARINGQEIDG
jgi:hypothetical protein